MIRLEIKVLDKSLLEEAYDGKNLLPKFGTENSAGMDIHSPDNYMLLPGEQVLVNTGFAIWIKNPGYAAFILPRSGLGAKGLVVGNLVGLIDADYQGEVKVCLWNRSLNETFQIARGDRFAQIYFAPVIQPTFDLVEEFTNSTARGEGGFGHTGVGA